MLKKITQFEIVELKKISVTENVPMTFKLVGDGTIDYDFAYNKSIQSIIKKNEDGYRIDASNSDGSSYFYSTDNFDSFRISVRKWIRAIKRDNPFEFERTENINKLSPNFYNIFQEATIIEELGFGESAGMIYRKALEFVVKDFLKSLLVDFHNVIDNKTIGQIISYFYDIKEEDFIIKEESKFLVINEELKTIRLLAKKIRNTFKIGNDFSHYDRKLSEYTTIDMKSNILQVVTFVNNLMEEKSLQAKRINLDCEFNADKLL